MPFPQSILIPKTLLLTPVDTVTLPVLVVVANVVIFRDLGPGNGTKVVFNTGANINQAVVVEETVADIFFLLT